MSKKKEKIEMTEDAAEDNASSIAMKPSAATTKLGAIAGVVDCLAQLETEQAINFLNVVLQSIGHEADNIDPSFAAKNAASVSMKPTDATMREAIEQDIKDIFGSDQELSEEFKEKAVTLFDAAVNVKVKMLEETLKEQYEQEIEEALTETTEELVDKVDKYITYAATEWLKENEVAIESTLRNEVTEEFIEGLKDLFAEHYIDVPEDKLDLVEELTTKLEETNLKVNALMSENIDLKNSLSEGTKEEILAKVSEGLTQMDQARLKTLSEGVEFDPITFEKKLNILKEGFIAKKGAAKTDNLIMEEIVEDEPLPKPVKAEVKQYVDVMDRMPKR